jgi:hypothetical protein
MLGFGGAGVDGVSLAVGLATAFGVGDGATWAAGTLDEPGLGWLATAGA